MAIKIKLFKEAGADPVDCEVSAGTSIEELLCEYRSHLPHRVITARVDGDNVPLSYVLEKDCELIFCDIRDDTAFRSFQRGLTLIYLKAVRDLHGDGVRALIRNSVNRGLFTTMKTEAGGAKAKAGKAEQAGQAGGAKAKADKPAGKQKDGDENYLSAFTPCEEDLRRIEKRMWQLVDANLPIENAGDGVHRLGDFSGSFYGVMPPSTGYIYSFALEPMRGGVLLRFPHPSDPGKLAIYRRDARIFDAYDEEQEFLDSLRLSRISDLNRQIGAGAGPDIIRIAESRQNVRILELSKRIAETGKRIVLIAGPSSSGKTTFSKRLIETIAGQGGAEPLYLGTDDYFIDREFAPRDKKGEYNFEGLDAMDVDLFTHNLEDLLSGKTTDIPHYDFLTGEKVFGTRKTKLKKDQVVVVEGIHALNKKMSTGIDEDVKFKVYISPLTQLNIDDFNRVPSTDVRLIRRMIRDNRARGHNVASTIRLWPKVRIGESINIFPYNNEADEVFNSTLIYELPVLKKYATPLLEEIEPGDPAYGHAKWLLYFLSFFSPIEDESAIPAESILREFIGGGRFGH